VADLVKADKLQKIYGTIAPTIAIDRVSFSVGAGEFASLVGQSGSGKSTLLNLIGLLDTPTSGQIMFKGEQTNKLGRKGRAELRNRLIGFIFQFHYLLPEFSVLENVLMPALIAGRKVDKKLNAFASELLSLLGLEELGGKNANQLSGGQKQRVAIGRALMNKPSLVLADEPTGNLDTSNTDQVYDLFRRINIEFGTAFLIVTHDRGIAQRTDRILEVQDGHLIQDVHNTYGAPQQPRQSDPGALVSPER
jgi:lipoprotein-releasing system ATP-binding protein